MKRLFPLFLTVLSFSLLVIACKNNDPCAEVSCFNGGCFEGICLCDSGYGGTDCANTCEALLTRSWNVTQSCDNGTSAYVTTVYADTTDSTVYYFTRLHSFAAPNEIYCTLDSCQLSFPAQGSGNVTLSGKGAWQGDDLILQLVLVENGAQRINCETVLRR